MIIDTSKPQSHLVRDDGAIGYMGSTCGWCRRCGEKPGEPWYQSFCLYHVRDAQWWKNAQWMQITVIAENEKVTGGCQWRKSLWRCHKGSASTLHQSPFRQLTSSWIISGPWRSTALWHLIIVLVAIKNATKMHSGFVSCLQITHSQLSPITIGRLRHLHHGTNFHVV